MEPFRQKGYSMASWSTFIFKSVYIYLLKILPSSIALKSYLYLYTFIQFWVAISIGSYIWKNQWFLTLLNTDIKPGIMCHHAQANICAIMIDQDHTRVIHNSEAWFRDAELKKMMRQCTIFFTNIYAEGFFFFFTHKWQWSALLSKKLNFLTQQEEVRLSERDYTSSHNTNDSDYSAKRTSPTVCPRQHVSVLNMRCARPWCQIL